LPPFPTWVPWRNDSTGDYPKWFLTEFPAITTDVSGLDSADGWVNEREKVPDADVRRLDSAELTLNAAELKGSHHRIYYFGNHFEKK
jgi:hypothetical protein